MVLLENCLKIPGVRFVAVCDIWPYSQRYASRRLKAVFSIEYEYNWTSSLPEIAQCVAYFEQVAGELAAASNKKGKAQ